MLIVKYRMCELNLKKLFWLQKTQNRDHYGTLTEAESRFIFFLFLFCVASEQLKIIKCQIEVDIDLVHADRGLAFRVDEVTDHRSIAAVFVESQFHYYYLAN